MVKVSVCDSSGECRERGGGVGGVGDTVISGTGMLAANPLSPVCFCAGTQRFELVCHVAD